MIVITSSGYEGDDDTASCCKSDIIDAAACPSQVNISVNSICLHSGDLWTTDSSKQFVTYPIPKSSYPFVESIKIRRRQKDGAGER